MKVKQKFATPIALWSFLIAGLSGVIIFFGFKNKNLTLIHEYVGLISVFGIMIHCMANLRPFKNYFKKDKGVILGVVFIIICLVFYLLYPQQNGLKKGKIVNNLIQTSLNKSVNDTLFYFDINKESFSKFCLKNNFDCSNLNLNLNDFAKKNSKDPKKQLLKL